MHNSTLRNISGLLVGLLFCLPHVLMAQSISGTVVDKKSRELLFGATVGVKGSTTGAATDLDGKFKFDVKSTFPVTLSVSYVGYVSKEVVVKEASANILIELSANENTLKEVSITDTRLTDKQRESAVTVESMDIIAIKQTPAASFYDGLGTLKGVDLTSASLGFKVINTRGFNSTSPVRSLQVIDGVDNQAPGLNFSLGNFLGSPELDVLKVDLVVGASSAFYGPNAFNGVISMSSRSPFIKPGFEISVKSGTRDLLETSMRYAKVFKDKSGLPRLGMKFNACIFKAHDWEATNRAATPQSSDSRTNPGGYDAVNTYGDEYFSAGATFSGSPRSFPGLGIIYRTGYSEKDLVDYNTRNVKLSAAFHYKVTRETELIYASMFGNGTTVYQGDNRYSLKDILFFQNRIELRKPNKFFIRAYYTNEDAGKSYDAFFTALLLQKSVKPDDVWAQDYAKYWQQNFKNIIFNQNLYPGLPQPPTPGSPNYSELYQQYIASINPALFSMYPDSMTRYHSLARAYADGVGNPANGYLAYLAPGTSAFDSAFTSITSRESYNQGGSRFFDKSALAHIHGEYQFKVKSLDFTTGANYRKYLPNSNGSIFSDSADRKITNSEWGAYLGMDKKFYHDKLKLNITGRVDKNENFDYNISPAASLIYIPNAENTIRVSFSSAIRNPTLADQYLYYPVGRAKLLGNLNGFKNLVTLESLLEAFNYSADSLRYFDVDPVVPEKVQTLEAGFRTSLFDHLFLDINGYYSEYRDFIGYRIGGEVTVNPNDPLPITVNNIYRVASNSKDKVSTHGASVGLNYYFEKSYSISSNWSWNELDRMGSDDPLIPAFNTPKNKFNLGFGGTNLNNKLGKDWGFNINYKWVQGHLFEGSPQFTGEIADYGLVDAQITKRFPDVKTIFKVGGTNIFNNEHYEVFGGPEIGRLVYFQILVELN